jgi:hypothetical protein
MRHLVLVCGSSEGLTGRDSHRELERLVQKCLVRSAGKKHYNLKVLAEAVEHQQFQCCPMLATARRNLPSKATAKMESRPLGSAS